MSRLPGSTKRLIFACAVAVGLGAIVGVNEITASHNSPQAGCGMSCHR
jgi:hypothetical protein